MSINSVKRSLSSLPYTEMRALGDQIIATLRERAKPKVGIVGLELDEVCDVLATLPANDGPQLTVEDKYLSQAFTKKRGGKCAIELKPGATGWEVQSGDFKHFAPTVRQALSELLDQVASYEALLGGEGRAR